MSPWKIKTVWGPVVLTIYLLLVPATGAHIGGGALEQQTQMQDLPEDLPDFPGLPGYLGLPGFPGELPEPQPARWEERRDLWEDDGLLASLWGTHPAGLVSGLFGLEPLVAPDDPLTLPEEPWADRVEDAGLTVAASDKEDCTPHPAIKIREDEGPEGFVLGHGPEGGPIYRPGSGVVSGTGTSADPYVIEGWCIVNNPELTTIEPVVSLEGTTAHVEIRGNQITQVQDLLFFWNGPIGVDLVGVENVKIVQNTLEAGFGWRGISIEDSRSVFVEDNAVNSRFSVAVDARESEDVRVVNNTFTGEYVAVGTYRTTELVIAGNDMGRSSYGLRVHDSPGAQVLGNDLDGTWFGAFLEDSPDSRLLENRFGASYTPLYLVTSPGSTIEDNAGVLTRGSFAIRSSDDVVLRGNDLGGMGGVYVMDSDGLVAEDNLVEGPVGLHLVTSQSATVTDNVLGEGGLVLDGTVVENFIHTVEGNTVNDLPIRYIMGVSGGDLPADTGQAILVDVEDFRVSDVRFEDVSVAVTAAFSRGLRVEDSQFIGTERAVVVTGSSDVRVEENIVIGGSAGLTFLDSDGVRVENNTLHGEIGVVLARSPGAELRGNTVSGATIGMILYGPGARLHENTLVEGGLLLAGPDVGDYEHEIDGSNTVGGRPVRYLLGVSDVQVPQDAGQVIVVDSQQVEIEGIDLQEAGVGIQVAFSREVQVRDVQVEDSLIGFMGVQSEDLVVEDGRFDDNAMSGVLLVDVQDVHLGPVHAHGNVETGLTVHDSDSVRVLEGNFQHNRFGSYLQDSNGVNLTHNGFLDNDLGLFLVEVPDAQISQNTFFANDVAMFILRGDGNRLRDNNLWLNEIGLWSAESGDLRLRGNNFEWNDHGLMAFGGDPVDARHNWWGHPTGPEHYMENPTGMGDDVWGDVEFRPWLLEPHEDAGP